MGILEIRSCLLEIVPNDDCDGQACGGLKINTSSDFHALYCPSISRHQFSEHNQMKWAMLIYLARSDTNTTY